MGLFLHQRRGFIHLKKGQAAAGGNINQNPLGTLDADILQQWRSDVIDAALGDAMGGTDGTTTIPFDANQVVPIDLGGTNEGLTINKLIEAKKLFWNNDVDLEDPMNELYMAVSGEQLANLFATTEVTSADYNTVKALVQGQVDSFMGFKFIQTQLLGADSPTETRSCFAWANQGIVLNLPEDITGSIDIRPDLSLGIQMYARASGNAVRMDEKLVVSLPCKEVFA